MQNLLFVMKTYFIGVFTLMISCSAYAEQGVNNESVYPKSLRVASSNSFPPINMLDSHGQLTGFGRDLSDAVLKSLGITVDRRHSAIWTDVIGWLDKEEIDFIHDTGYTKERDASLDFTLPIIEMPEMIFVRSDNLDINTLESLNGKVVACINKHITHLYLQKFPGIKCHVFNKPVEGLYALAGGTVDAFVYPREIVMYFAQQLRVAGDIKMVGEPLRYLSWSMTVKEGNSRVVNILNEGIKRVRASGEYDRIHDKWFGKRLLAGYTEAEVRIIVATVVVLSLFAGISIVLLIYNRRLNNAKDALEQSEKKYSEVAASVPGAVFQVSRHGNAECQMEFISLGIAKTIGVSSNQLLGDLSNFTKYIYVEDRERFAQSLQESIQELSPWQIEFRIETNSQQTLWFQASSTPKMSGDKSLVYNGILLNITGHKELQVRQELFFQLSNNMLCIAGFDGYFKLLNPSWATTLGYSIPELRAEPFVNFVHPDDQEATILEAQKLSERDGHTVNFENRYRCKNGEYRYLSWMAVSSPYADEIYAAAHDITELKNAEDELRHAYDDLEERVELRTVELKEANEHLKKAEQAMREAKEEADSANKSKSEFLSRMSHELRTPLNAIIGFSQLIETDPEIQDTEQVEFAGEILHAGNHLLELINEVLDLSKIEAGKLDVCSDAINLRYLLDECFNLIKQLANDSKIKIIQPEWMRPIYVEGDRLRLKQVMLNLLSNAVKYNVEGGSVTVRCAISETDNVEISVSDTGQGISQSGLTQLFQPFNRLSAEQSDIQGTGIGLMITKRLVELMKGTLTVTSEPGKGSCFTLSLIGTEAGDSEEMDASLSNVSQPVSISSDNYSKYQIVCVEDNEANIRLIKHMLSKIPGINLITANTAEKGVELIKTYKPDLILMDINLPGMNGYEALEYIQAQPELSGIPVIAVTADAMPASRSRGLTAGFTDYIVKPIDVRKLLAVVSQYMEKGDSKQTDAK